MNRGIALLVGILGAFTSLVAFLVGMFSDTVLTGVSLLGIVIMLIGAVIWLGTEINEA